MDSVHVTTVGELTVILRNAMIALYVITVLFRFLV